MRKIRLQKRANVPTGRRVLNSILFHHYLIVQIFYLLFRKYIL